jgi:serine/threonine-protein kinase ULK/ATG1
LVYIEFCLFEDKVEKFIGKGKFGKVFKCTELKTYKTVAIKSIDIDTEEEKKSANEEEKILKKLQGCSPYLMDLIDSFEEVIYLLIY